MYKQKNNGHPQPGGQKSPFGWIKRRIILLISAIMIGMSNAIYEEDKTINGNREKIEQKQDKD